MSVDPPSPDSFAPAPITSTTGKADLKAACPFLNPATPLCCGDDTALIMKTNYQSLDAVFNSDCPICAANLKTMWCEYACNPNKIDFLDYLGTAEQGGKTFAEVNFNLDSTYACGLFQSCQ